MPLVLLLDYAYRRATIIYYILAKPLHEQKVLEIALEQRETVKGHSECCSQPLSLPLASPPVSSDLEIRTFSLQLALYAPAHPTKHQLMSPMLPKSRL